MTGTLGEALDEAVARLRAAGVPGAERDALVLLRATLGRTGFDRGDRADSEAARLFERRIARRAGREPVSRILGRRAFWTGAFEVTGDVLDPRPETERLVELALSEPFGTVLDLGTGSGCILISLLSERPRATGLGTDMSEAALAVAGRNAAAHGVASRARFAAGSWYAPVKDRFALIVSNPPYIAREELAGLSPEVRGWDPEMALTDGGDGLGAYRAIAAGAGAHLAPGGRLLTEIGPTQGAAVKSLFAEAGLEDIAVHDDLDGRHRVVSGRGPSA